MSVLRIAASLALAITLAIPAVAEDKGVSVSGVWARATPGGAKIGAAYGAITAKADDKLVSIATPMAGKTELHTHLHEDGVMKMRRVEAFEIKAGETKTLAPGGDHLMLFDLKEPLKEGGKLPITLTFEKAGDVTVEADILAIGAKGPGSKSAEEAVPAGEDHTGHGEHSGHGDHGDHKGHH